MGLSNYIKVSMGLEDADTNVEINFNVDTDDNGAPISPVDADGDESPEAAQVEAIEAEAEANKTEQEQQELEEAQEALESLKLVLEKAGKVGGIDEVSAEMFNIALGSIIGDKNLANQITTESAFVSKAGRLLHYQNVVDVALETNKKLSMEGVGELFAKAKEAIQSFFKMEVALVKRVKALVQLAEAADGEHADKDTVPVNGKEGIKVKELARIEFDKPEDVVNEFKKLVKLFDSIASPNVDKLDEENLGRSIFKLDDKDLELVRGKDGTYHKYEYMGNTLKIMNKDISIVSNDVNKSVSSLPMLTSDQCKDILNEMVRLIEERKVILDLLDYLEALTYIPPEQNHTQSEGLKAHYAGEVNYILSAMLQDRAKLFYEMVNYCGYCIQHRGQN